MVSFAPQWLAIWTRSRHEQRVYDQLVARDIEAFLPSLLVPSTRRDRRKMIRVPAFPGYLFVRIDATEQAEVTSTRGVVRILGPTAARHTVVPAEQVEAVRQMLCSELQVDPFPHLKAGMPVRVKSGPLCGLEGYVVEKRRQLRFVVSVDLLHQGVSAEVSADQLESA